MGRDGPQWPGALKVVPQVRQLLRRPLGKTDRILEFHQQGLALVTVPVGWVRE